MSYETWKVEENNDTNKGAVHVEYWEAFDPETGIQVPGETEDRAVDNLFQTLESIED